MQDFISNPCGPFLNIADPLQNPCYFGVCTGWVQAMSNLPSPGNVSLGTAPLTATVYNRATIKVRIYLYYEYYPTLTEWGQDPMYLMFESRSPSTNSGPLRKKTQLKFGTSNPPNEILNPNPEPPTPKPKTYLNRNSPSADPAPPPPPGPPHPPNLQEIVLIGFFVISVAVTDVFQLASAELWGLLEGFL